MSDDLRINIFKPNQNDIGFFTSKRAVEELEKVDWPNLRKTRSLASFLMSLYMKPDLSFKQRENVYSLLILMSKRGVDANTKCAGRMTFAFYAYHFKMIEVVANLANNKYPTAGAGIQLIGFFGSFIKNIVNIANKNITLSSVNNQNNLFRQHYYLNNRELLRKIQSGKDVHVKDVFEIINSTDIEINPVDIKYKFKFSPSKNFSAQKNHIIHVAVNNYNLNALQKIINQGCNPYVLNKHKRNIWHLAEIVDATDIKKYLYTLPDDIQNKLRSAKDVFGRTPDDIGNIKSKYIIANIPENTAVQSGGWDATEAEQWRTNRCDIDIINYDEIDAKKLINDYISIQKPVLIKNAIHHSLHLRKLFEKENFKSLFGKTMVSTGEIPYSSTYHKKESRGEFFKLKRGINHYVFCGLDKNRDQRLISEFANLELTKNLNNENWQFYAGPKETGAPLHVHTNAWNLLIYGKKRWIIDSPFEGVYSIEHIRKWLKYNEGKHREFIQEAGDLVYIPRYWSHGVINLKESIGVATEFTSPYIY